MPYTRFNEDRCKGCKLCVSVCPQKIIIVKKDKLNDKGYHPTGIVEMDKCTGCAFCATICPDCAIEVEK